MTTQRFSLFGEIVDSEITIPARMDPAGSRASDFLWTLAASSGHTWQDAPAVFTSEERVHQQPAHQIHALGSTDAPEWGFAETGVANFGVTSTAIAVELLDPAYEYMAEIRLLGQLSAVRAHMRERVAIHAAVVEIDGSCIALAATNGGGKTSTTATLLSMGGTLVADDLLVIGSDGIAESGYPQMRMWVPEAEYFHGDAASLDRVHPTLEKRRIPIGTDFGTFSSGPRPLDAIVILEREEAAPSTVQLDPMRALPALVDHIFLRGMLRPMGYAASAFSICGDLVERIPTYIARSPSVTHDELPALCDGLLDAVLPNGAR